jgi:hypothetical protein
MDFIEADYASVAERLADPHEVWQPGRGSASGRESVAHGDDRARSGKAAQRSRLERHGPDWCSAGSDRAAAMTFGPFPPDLETGRTPGARPPPAASGRDGI